MKDDIKKIFNIDETSEFEFREIYGFTFVFVRKIIHINDILASGEIKPLGIIYEENDEYYFAPLDRVDNINTIIQDFVETCLI